MTTTDYIILSFAGGIMLGTCFGMLLGVVIAVKIEDLRRWLRQYAARRTHREMSKRYSGPTGIASWQQGKRGTNSYGDTPE